jgi:GNAT superfamily N-acetyltransferase
MPFEIVPTRPTEADAEAVSNVLRAYNDAAVGPSGYEPIAFLIKDTDSGATIGGLCGDMYYDWLFVKFLVVPESLRGEDLGSRLLGMAEATAREKGCIGVWLDTFSFQAPGFYLKQGYEPFGTIENYPKGGSRIFFRKRLG